ncbi:zinc finger protein castor homolog 1-like isoform X3 [Apostichopus japonicus]|uniref:zinc finger protein castor homolog 1-like isoform X3 n=1 Tax=Stichopus japonicus TaxID=307972 RepID=UPI003AB30411
MSKMSKTKVKLDAICAKLKKSLAQPGDSDGGAQVEQDPGQLEEQQDLAESLSENATKVDSEETDVTMNGDEKGERFQNSLVGTEVNGVEDGGTDSIPSSRASTPTQCNNNSTPTRTLTGASRRKSKKKVSRVEPTDFETEQRGPLALSENVDYLSADKLEENSCKTSISDFSTRGDHINSPTMHRSNGYGDRSSPMEEIPQDLSVHTVHHRKAHKGTGGSRKPNKRYARDSYDPLAIANFAERSNGHEESDLLIDEGEDKEQEKGEEEEETGNDTEVHGDAMAKREEPYPSEPEDLSMPKAIPHQQKERESPTEGTEIPRDRVNGFGAVVSLNNNNKDKAMYDTAAVREYAANTMKEFLGMYGYEDEHRGERDDVRLDNFAFGQLTQENLKAHPKRPVDAFRARLEQEIRANPPKLDGRLHDELQPQFMHMKLQKRTSSGKRKLGLHNGSQTFVKKMNLHVKGPDKGLSEGESISHDIPNTRISKYDSYIHQLNQGNSIEKVIGKREMENQKTLDDINLHLKQKLSSPNGSRGSSPGDRGSRLHHGGGGQDFDSPGVSLAQNLLPGSPYPLLTSIPGLHPLPPMMAGPLTALNLSNRMELGAGPQSGSLPRTSAESSSKPLESSPSGLFKRSMIAGGADEAEIFGSEPVKGFSKYIARYAANENCQHCGFHYKEHFHCMETECSFARFTRKEDVMRHYNWHRRRDDSLQHGFMRFSPSDDCSPHYPGCALNFRNTHYHCMQQGCNKVYTSTSDVLGHENFHKKNATLLNEGFQRFRATEDCGNRLCEFYGQKTTHFHCQRHGCNFVFKNKYDIERHKTFHTKDDIYKREGFKKFSKHESCKYESCPYSHMLNHFHCLRPGCNFVFTTANQMHSHKRKHERLERIIRYDRSAMDKHCPAGIQHPSLTGMPGTSSGHPLSLVKSESSILQNVLQSPMVVLKPGISYTALSLANQMPMINTSMGPLHLMPPPSMSGDGCGAVQLVKSEPSSPEMSRPPPPYKERDSPKEKNLAEAFAKIESTVGSSEGEELNDSLNLPIPSEISPPNGSGEEGSDEDKSADEGKQEDTWRKYLKRYTANDPCNSRCELLYKDHYHCVVDNCGQVFKSKESVKKHTRYHFMSEEATKLGFQFFPHGQSCEEKFKGCVFSPLAHYHCMWSLQPGSYCGEVIHTGSSLMRPHFDKHVKNPTLGKIQDRVEDSPEEEEDEESQPPSPAESPPQSMAPPVATIRPQTVSTITTTSSSSISSPPQLSPTAKERGYDSMEADKCPREECPLSKQIHFHCVKADCQYATENVELMMDHKTNEKLIFDSFKQCSRKLDCHRPGCKYNMLHKHFHCMHQGCHFSFLQVQQMESHGRKHMRRIYGKLFNRPNSNNPGSGQQFVLPIMSMARSESPPMVGPPTMVSSAPFYQSLISSAVIQGIPGSTTLSWSAIPQPTLVNVTGITPHTSLHNPQQLLLPISSLAGQPQATDTPSPSSAYARYGEASSPPSAASPGRSYSPRKRPLTLVIEDPGAPSGYKRYKRGPLDSSMQEKFQRFERSEHCGDAGCQYTLNSTHYHCLHEGCDYRFAGKTMMYKHAQHHDRVDSIIQDDFQRYKSTMDCKRGDCEFGSKSTHFHCLRCPFICTDSGKVAVHRNQHSMSVVAEKNGFKHFSSSNTCPYSDCKFSQKSSHFHCEKSGCTSAIMGLMQMEIHLRNHQEEPIMDTPTSTSVA